jgi:hypothetical protein
VTGLKFIKKKKFGLKQMLFIKIVEILECFGMPPPAIKMIFSKNKITFYEKIF